MVGWTPSIMVPRFFATPLHLTAFLDTAKSCFTSSVTTSPPISSAMFRPMREREREREVGQREKETIFFFSPP